jgi:hypothetical protein
MSKTSTQFTMSLDGFIAGPHDEIRGIGPRIRRKTRIMKILVTSVCICEIRVQKEREQMPQRWQDALNNLQTLLTKRKESQR